MSRTLAAAALAFLLLYGSVARAIINPRFTPVQLVSEADQIFAGPLEASTKPLEWKMAAATRIKGKSPPTSVLNLATCEKDHLDEIRQALKDNRGPAVLFFGSQDGQKRAFLHVAGQWVKLQPAETGRWDVLAPAPDMVGTFAGGSDMLIRMAQYLVRDTDAEVPVTVGVRWSGQAKLGNVPGTIAGMTAVEFGKAGQTCLFVGSSDGDRLFRPKGQDALEDITAAAGLDSKSRRFTWIDIDGDGLADLVSWDGENLSVRLAGSDGKFKPAGPGFSLALAGCLGLAPCSTDRLPGVLVSSSGRPLLLAADGGRGWKKMPLAGDLEEDLGQPSACVVADFDNDGFADVLQPAQRGGILWKGKAGGFDKPLRPAVATGGGTARAAPGDFAEKGSIDVFLAGPEKNTLWENDGKGNFREVLRYAGSLGYKCPAGAADAQVMDLNHDGRPDLFLAYEQSDLLYHFNRGFRSFAEEGELRLPGTQTAPGQPRLGQKAVAAGDFNGDGSLDLAVLLTNGDLVCYFNDKMSMPGLRLRLPKGMTGPVTASCWLGDEHPICTGTLSVAGHSPAAYVALRSPGACKVRYRLPGGTEQVKNVTVEDGPKDLVLDGVSGKK